MTERRFQSYLKDKIKKDLKGAMVLKTDPADQQGIPDLIIFYKDRWASLEVKNTESAPKRPNQEYFVNLMNTMSYSSFIYPENEKEVLYELYRALRAPR